MWQTPALAGLTITNRQRASTELTTGPQFYAYGSGQTVEIGDDSDWAGFELTGLAVDTDTGNLVLGRAGDVAPSATPWHNEPSTSRACEVAPAAGVRLLSFDAQREIDAGRLRADLADIRVHQRIDGVAVPFRTGSPESTSVVVDTSAYETDVDVCVYWGDPDASSMSDPSIRGPVVPDGGWSWRVWDGVGDGLSIDLVDWSDPSSVTTVPSGSVPVDVCNQCATELIGFITPAVSGAYRFFLSADDVGRLELAPAENPSALETIVELSAATPAGSFSDPVQASALVPLEAGQAYAIRARAKDLEFGDHLEIAFAIDGEPPVILPTEVISDETSVPGSLTHRRFDVVETTDRSGPPTSIARVETSQNAFDTCDDCAHSIAGYVVVPATGTYRFWISSDDEGSLLLSVNGDPASASRIAWITNFTGRSNWTADPSQASAEVQLEAGQTIWMEAYNRDRGGPDHLQVGWSRVDVDPAEEPTVMPGTVLSEAPPVDAPLPIQELGPVEGQQAASGFFVSPPVDTTTGGSNVFGRFVRSSIGPVSIEASFASDPDGPWSPVVDVGSGMPVPLGFDGARYVRFNGEFSSADGAEPSIESIGLERDLDEATSVDATSTVTVPGAGEHAALRVRGSIGKLADATVGATATAGVDAWLMASIDPSLVDEVVFGDGDGHHLGVTVDADIGPTSARLRWTAVDGTGLTVVHDVVVVIEGA